MYWHGIKIMSDACHTFVFQGRILSKTLPGAVNLVGRDEKFLRKLMKALRSTIVTPSLRIETYNNALVTPRGATRATIHSGNVYDDSGAPIPLAQFIRGTSIRFGGEVEATLPKPGDELDEAIWGGVWVSHYGHFITESVARLYPAWSSDAPIIFVASPGASLILPPWMGQVLAFLGIDAQRIRIITRPTRVRRLIMPTPGLELSRSFSPDYFRLLRSKVRDALRGAADTGESKLFLSRSLLGDKRAGVGEKQIESALLADGWSVLHPETLPFADQMSVLSRSRAIAGLFGSQMHNLIFHPGDRLDVLHIATDQLGATFIHCDLVTEGTKVVGYCGDYCGLPPFRSLAPFRIDGETAEAALQAPGVDVKLKDMASCEQFESIWLDSVVRTRIGGELKAQDMEKVFRQLEHRPDIRLELERRLALA